MKSGVDYKNFSFITVSNRDSLTEEEQTQVPSEAVNDSCVQTGQTYSYQIKDNQYVVNIVKHDVTKAIEPDEVIHKEVQDHYQEFDKKMQLINSKFDCEIDSLFSKVRTEETAIGNFIADLIRKEHHADIGLVNSGIIRADKVYEQGEQPIGTWWDLFPFTTPVVKMEITGAILLSVLQNSVSAYPAFNGKFLQVSGIKFSFNPVNEPGSRLQGEVLVNGEVLDLEKKYTVACPYYLASGKEGYDAMLDAVELVDHENAPTLKNLLADFFGNFFLI